MEIIKRIVRVGNGAGVILPREWRGGEARIELLQRPIDLEKDVFEILRPYLHDVLGVYLVGSYARKEETDESDVDVLVVSSNTNNKISSGKYSIIIVSLENLEKSIKERALPLYSMIQEAKALINRDLLEKLKRIKLSPGAIKWNLEAAKSALDITKKLINEEETISGGIVYVLILRIRGLYLIKRILNGKKYSNSDFLKMLEREKIDKKAYEIYQMEKRNKISKPIDAKDGERILNLAEKLLEEVRCPTIKK